MMYFEMESKARYVQKILFKIQLNLEYSMNILEFINILLMFC